MKTIKNMKVVIDESSYRNDSNYRHLYMQLLKDNKYYGDFSPFATISFQTDKDNETGRSNTDGKIWYGMKLSIEVESVNKYEDVQKFADIVKYLYTTIDSYPTQPLEVMALLNAEEYIRVGNNYGGYVPASHAGRSFYRIDKDGLYEMPIVAANERLANIEFDKLSKKHKWDGKVEMKFSHIITK